MTERKQQRIKSRGTKRLEKSAENRLNAVVDVYGVVLGEIRVSASPREIGQSLILESMKQVRCVRSGFVAIAIGTVEPWQALVEKARKHVCALIADCLNEVLSDIRSPVAHYLSKSDIWVDCHFESDYESARQRATEAHRDFGKEAVWPTLIRVGKPVLLTKYVESVVGDGRPGQDKQAGEYAEERAKALALVDHAREEAARVLEPAINSEAARRAHHDYDSKKELAKWVNAELRRAGGLAIRCPRTGQPSLLVANPGGQPGIGRFHLEHTDPSGRRHRTVTSVELPKMNLMLDNLTRAPYGQRSR